MRVGEYQARAADRDGLPRLLLELAGGPAMQQLASPGADHRAVRGRGEQRGREQPDHLVDRAGERERLLSS
jgi:hypothetical protein